jgi:hypothetical protein
MIFQRIDKWIEQHLATIGSVLIALVLLVYIISQFVPDISEWIISRGFFNVLLIALIVDLLHKVIELKGSPPGMQICEDQQQALPQIQAFLEKERPETCDLLEYSTSSTRTLLQELRKANVRIRLLMCHPERAISTHERMAIEVGIDNVRKDFKDYKRIKAKLYATPASLRGRSVGGKLINVGWYVYSHSEGELSIRGHDNAMVLSDTDTPQGQNLKHMFNSAFDALWNDPTTMELVLAAEVEANIDRTSDLPRVKPRRSS